MLVFVEGGKQEYPEKNPWSRLEDKNQKQTQLTFCIMASTPGIKPGLHWWEASALITVPSPLPEVILLVQKQLQQKIYFNKIYVKSDHVLSGVIIILEIIFISNKEGKDEEA